jgi:hypothetical protein
MIPRYGLGESIFKHSRISPPCSSLELNVVLSAGRKCLVYLEGTLSSGIFFLLQKRDRHFISFFENTLPLSLLFFLCCPPGTTGGKNGKKTRGVCHTVTLPFTLKSILMQTKKNYGNSIISPFKNILFNKSSKRNQNPSRYYYNSIITNLKFQHKPKYHLSKILI